MENPFKNLKIKNYYTYVLVAGGFVFLISLFYEPKIISQGKLAIMSLISVVYGLFEWIRESQFNDKLKQLDLEWRRFWENESAKKGLNEIMDKTWEEKTLEAFQNKTHSKKLLPHYQAKTWVFLVICIALMIGAFFLIPV